MAELTEDSPEVILAAELLAAWYGAGDGFWRARREPKNSAALVAAARKLAAEREAAAYQRGQEEMRDAAGDAVADCYFQECCGEPMQDGECCGVPRIVFSPEAAQSLGETIAALPIKEKPE